MNRERSHTVEEKFSHASDEYEQHASLQREVAGRLAAALTPWRLTLPQGTVLEIGAGTGFLSRELPHIFPGRKIVISDISEKMLISCRENLSGRNFPDLEFSVMDAEGFRPGEESYALVAGSFVAQWFKDPALTLGRFAEALKPGGLMLLSFPGHDSFPEWRENCLELGLPYTGNPLPDTEEMVIKLSAGGAQVDYYEDQYRMEFPDTMSFFRHLKQIGSSSLRNKRLTYNQLKMLAEYWDKSADGPISVTWHLVFLALKKDL